MTFKLFIIIFLIIVFSIISFLYLFFDFIRIKIKKKILIKLFKKFKKEIEILLKIKKLEEIDYHKIRFKIIKIKIFF